MRNSIDHETHLGYNSRSIYHGVSNLVKLFFGRVFAAVRWTSLARSPIVSHRARSLSDMAFVTKRRRFAVRCEVASLEKPEVYLL